MEDSFQVTCPCCGETFELFLEPDGERSWVQDCEVCCNLWRFRSGPKKAIAGSRWEARMDRNSYGNIRSCQHSPLTSLTTARMPDASLSCKGRRRL